MEAIQIDRDIQLIKETITYYWECYLFLHES